MEKKKARCRCKTNARLAKYYFKSKSHKYMKPCQVEGHDEDLKN